MMRDSGDEPTRVQRSVSTDNGESWTAALKTEIPNTASVELYNLANGRWAFVGNDIDDGRYRLSLFISDDEGATWKWKTKLEDKSEGNFSYPGMVQTADGLLHITYSYHEGDKRKAIKYRVIDISLREASLPGAFLRERSLPEDILTESNSSKIQESPSESSLPGAF